MLNLKYADLPIYHASPSKGMSCVFSASGSHWEDKHMWISNYNEMCHMTYSNVNIKEKHVIKPQKVRRFSMKNSVIEIEFRSNTQEIPGKTR